MKRSLLTFAMVSLMFSQAVGLVAALTLESIGTSSVGGRSISSWYYQGSNPTFSGTAEPSASVTIGIDGATGTATANESGNWTYAPTTLTTVGIYPITITSGAASLAFNLDITAVGSSSAAPAATGAAALPDELPRTGSFEQTLLLMGSGLGLMLAGVMFYWKVVPRLLLENSANEEDEE